MYLTEQQVTDLLAALAGLAAPGSALAVNFGVGFEGDDSWRTRAVAAFGRAMAALGNEPMKFRLAPDDTSTFLATAGWTTKEIVTGPELARRYLTGTDLAKQQLNPLAFVVTATRSCHDPIAGTPARSFLA